MSRLSEVVSAVKRDLSQWNQRTINTTEIHNAINRAQREIATRLDVVEAEITLTMVDGTAAYDIRYDPDGDALDVVKRVISMKTPQNWSKLQWKTSKQFDDMQEDVTLGYPLYVTIRNKQLIFHGAPGSSQDGDEVVLHTFLFKPTEDADDSTEIEVPQYFDSALRFYADYYLLPLNHPDRQIVYAEFENEIRKYEGTYNHTDSYARVPEANW